MRRYMADVPPGERSYGQDLVNVSNRRSSGNGTGRFCSAPRFHANPSASKIPVGCFRTLTSLFQYGNSDLGQAIRGLPRHLFFGNQGRAGSGFSNMGSGTC